MKRAILTVGPQYAGKSTFCEKVVVAHPEVVIISRDKLRVQVYGSVYTDPYQTNGWEAERLMWEAVAKHLAQPEIALILDCWNLSAAERQNIFQKLKDYGATRIDLWHFTTSPDTCVQWSLKRDPPSGGTDERWHQARIDSQSFFCRRNCDLFRRETHGIENEPGFDTLVNIDPLVTDPANALGLPPNQLLLF